MTNALSTPPREAALQPVLPPVYQQQEIASPPLGWNPNLVIAVNKIGVGDPDAEMIATGKYDDQGAAIVRKATRTVMPGEYFELSNASDLRNLLIAEAVRYPDEREIALRALQGES